MKQLYLGSTLVILDEPTSVLTPQEADEVLGMLREMAHAGQVSVAVITHRFREVKEFADEVTERRRGRRAGGGPSAEHTPEEIATLMMGAKPPEARLERSNSEPAPATLEISELTALRRFGIACAQGNQRVRTPGRDRRHRRGLGQRTGRVREVLAGQRKPTGGSVRVGGKDYLPTRAQIHQRKVRLLSEAPLVNACVSGMPVAENLAFRGRPASLHLAQVGPAPRRLLPARALQGPEIEDQGAVAACAHRHPVRWQRTARGAGSGARRGRGAAHRRQSLFRTRLRRRERSAHPHDAGAQRRHCRLLISADLEEIFALADRIVVMSEGRLVHETGVEQADVQEIGRHMAGHH